MSLILLDELFSGFDNPLQLRQHINAVFTCDMALHNFPFDIQRCELIFKLMSAQTGFAEWVTVSTKYLGKVYEIYTLL